MIRESINLNRLHVPGRPPVKNIVVRSEARAEETVIKMSERARDMVLFASAEAEDSVIQGFTVTGGSSGVYCWESSPTISKCIVWDNVSILVDYRRALN